MNMNTLKKWEAVVRHKDGTKEAVQVEAVDRGWATTRVIEKMPVDSIFITHVSEIKDG